MSRPRVGGLPQLLRPGDGVFHRSFCYVVTLRRAPWRALRAGCEQSPGRFRAEAFRPLNGADSRRCGSAGRGRGSVWRRGRRSAWRRRRRSARRGRRRRRAAARALGQTCAAAAVQATRTDGAITLFGTRGAGAIHLGCAVWLRTEPRAARERRGCASNLAGRVAAPAGGFARGSAARHGLLALRGVAYLGLVRPLARGCTGHHGSLGGSVARGRVAVTHRRLVAGLPFGVRRAHRGPFRCHCGSLRRTTHAPLLFLYLMPD